MKVKWLLSPPEKRFYLCHLRLHRLFFVGSVQICIFTRSFGVIIFFCWLHFLCCCFDLYYSWVQLHLCPFYHCVFPIFECGLIQKYVKNRSKTPNPLVQNITNSQREKQFVAFHCVALSKNLPIVLD